MSSNALKTAFSVFNGFAPKEGPKYLPIPFDFTVNATQEIELLQENTQGVIQYVQSIYVDNSANPNTLTIFIPATLQRLVIPATAQGVWPIFSIDQVRMTLSSTVDPAAIGAIGLINVPMPLTQWGPNNINVTVNNDPLVSSSNILSWSDTVGAGGVSQPAIPANALRRAWFIQNPPTETEVLYVEFATAATPGISLELAPGQTFPPDGSQSVYWNGLINVTADTTGHVFIAKEFFA